MEARSLTVHILQSRRTGSAGVRGQKVDMSLPFYSVQTLGGVDDIHLHWGGLASVLSLPVPVLVSPETPHRHPQKRCFTSSPGIPEPRHHRVFICGVELLGYSYFRHIRKAAPASGVSASST